MDITTVFIQRSLRNHASARGLAWLAACAIPLSIGVGCGAEEADGVEDLEDFDSDRIVEIINVDTCVALANRKKTVGTVCTSIDNTVDTSAQCGVGATGVMNITYETTGPWELVKTHLAVGKGLEDIPANRRGRIKHKWFPYIDDGLEGTTSHTVAVPLCELGLDGADEACDPVNAHIVARAKVRKLRNNGTWRYKRAWGDGKSLGCRHRRGRFFTMELGCSANPEPPPPPVAQCETAYAYSPGGECFLGADFDGDGTEDGHANWGWSIGPVASNTTTQWPVYAAVGGCDPSRGTHVGNLAIDYDGSTATVVFDRVGTVTLDEEQIYIGSTKLPLDANGEFTVNPADFPIAVDLDGAEQSSTTVTGLSEDIHVVYHALACGDGLTPPQDPLAVLTDEFEADDLSAWNIYNSHASYVSVDGGEMELLPYINAWWFDGQEAVHVSKSVTGNFSITAKVEVTNLLGGPTVPGAPYRIGGIMLRDPNAIAGEPNTYHMGIGNMNTGVVTAVSKSTAEGLSDVNTIDTSVWPGDSQWDEKEAEMRLCRVDDQLSAYIRIQDEPWTRFDTHTRPDMPDIVSAGPIAYTGFIQENLRATFDWVEYKTITDPADCFVD
ncbi:MAG: hypothetical protein AAGF11_16250 [Myxococcota bacterium]